MVSNKWDLMISYCWGQQNLVLQIKQKLEENGFSIWIDTEQMAKYKNMPEAMGDGISNSTVVLMCISSDYEKSSRCEQEAEFVSQKNKSRIIIKVAKNYHPKTKWLEFLMGDRLYFEMDSPKKIDASFSQLESAIGRFVAPKKKLESKKKSSELDLVTKTECPAQTHVTRSDPPKSQEQLEPKSQPGRVVIPKVFTDNVDSSDVPSCFEGISLRPVNPKPSFNGTSVGGGNDRSVSPNVPCGPSSQTVRPVSPSFRGGGPNMGSRKPAVTGTVASKVVTGNDLPEELHQFGGPSLRSASLQNDPSFKSGTAYLHQSGFSSSSSSPQVVEFKSSTTRTRTVSEYTQSADGKVVVKKSEWKYTDNS